MRDAVKISASIMCANWLHLEKDLQILELSLDRYYLDEVVSLSMKSSLTVGPTIRFLISKEFETRNLITVLRGLHYKLSSENVLALTVYEKNTSSA